MKTTLKTLGVTLAAGASSLLMGGQAQAISLVPQAEGQIDVGSGCFTTCITLNPLIASVQSLVDATTGTQSLLFVDDLATGVNSYNGGAIQFQAGDTGTTPTGYWFRPVEVESRGGHEENGQLEVGTFRFNFAKTLKSLTVAYFDTESNNTTGVSNSSGSFISVLGTDGTLVAGLNPISQNGQSNIQYQTWSNVNYITLKLGGDNVRWSTGDGVDFQLSADVPEPTSMASLALVGIAGGLGALRKRRIASEG
jgi:hypothetical protein